MSCFVQVLTRGCCVRARARMQEVPLCLISPPAGKQLPEQLLGQASLRWHSVGFPFICSKKSKVGERKNPRKAEKFLKVSWLGGGGWKEGSRWCMLRQILRLQFLRMRPKLNIYSRSDASWGTVAWEDTEILISGSTQSRCIVLPVEISFILQSLSKNIHLSLNGDCSLEWTLPHTCCLFQHPSGPLEEWGTVK